MQTFNLEAEKNRVRVIDTPQSEDDCLFEIVFKNTILPKCRECMIKDVGNLVPVYGSFKKVGVICNVPETSEYEAVLIADYIPNEPKSRTLQIGVKHKSSDRLFSHLLLKDSKDKIIEYLKDDNKQDEIINSIETLTKQADEYYSSL